MASSVPEGSSTLLQVQQSCLLMLSTGMSFYNYPYGGVSFTMTTTTCKRLCKQVQRRPTLLHKRQSNWPVTEAQQKLRGSLEDEEVVWNPGWRLKSAHPQEAPIH